MKELIQRSKENKAATLGLVGAVASGGLLVGAEIYKEPVKPGKAELRIEFEVPKEQRNMARIDGNIVTIPARPKEFVVVQDEAGNLGAETVVGHNPVAGEMVQEELDRLQDLGTHNPEE